MADQQAHANNLKSSRADTLKNSARQAKKTAKEALNVASVMAQFNPLMDWLFAIAFIAALLKDILDIVNTVLIAAGGIGAVLIFIFTLMASAVIGFIMILTGSSGKTKMAKTIAKRITKRIAILAGATLVELIPGVDLLPIESLVVVVIFWMTLDERKLNAEKEREATAAKNAQRQTNNQSTANALPA